MSSSNVSALKMFRGGKAAVSDQVQSIPTLEIHTEMESSKATNVSLPASSSPVPSPRPREFPQARHLSAAVVNPSLTTQKPLDKAGYIEQPHEHGDEHYSRTQ